MVVSKILLWTGAVMLLHAAYSLQHYRSLIQNLEESTTGISSDVEVVAGSVYKVPPADVWIEMAVAFVVLFVSELTRTGSSLQPVKGIDQKPMIAQPFFSRDFDIYSSRARGFSKGKNLIG
jgi:Membrane magnesium transporter